MSSEPIRSDAVMVYAWLRAVRGEGGATVPEIAFQCFPSPTDGPESSVRALRRVGVTRTLDALVWLRGQGVEVRCVAGVRVTDGDVEPTRWTLGGSSPSRH
jgi:hypothetical protein